jgi:hypothetical protein
VREFAVYIADNSLTVCSVLVAYRLRNEKDPYLGLTDCAKRILDEEGWMALYRAWWLTMLGGLAGAFA